MIEQARWFGQLLKSCAEKSPGAAVWAAPRSPLILQHFSLPVEAFEKLASIKR